MSAVALPLLGLLLAAPAATSTLPPGPAVAPSVAPAPSADPLRGDWPGNERRVTVDFDREPTRDALRRLASAAGWSLVLRDTPRGRVDMSLDAVPADEALRAILSSQNLVAERDGGLVTVAAASPSPALRAAAPGDTDATEGRVRLGGSVHVAQGEVVREAVALGGSTQIDGTVLKDAVALGGSTHVEGTVHGNAVAVGGTLRLGPRAVVHGDAVAVGGAIEADPGAVVEGNRVSGREAFTHHGARKEPGSKSWLGTLASGLVRFGLLFALGMLLMSLAPARVRSVERELRRAPLASAGIGLAAAVALVPLTVLLVVTLVGILVVPFLYLALGAALVLGLSALALAVGERFPPNRPGRTVAAALGIGVGVLFLVDLVPVLGALVLIALSVLAVGATLNSRFGSRPEGGGVAPNP